MWDVASGQEFRTLKGHTGWVHGVALSADGQVAVSASYDGTLKVWDVFGGQELLSPKEDTIPVLGQLPFVQMGR